MNFERIMMDAVRKQIKLLINIYSELVNESWSDSERTETALAYEEVIVDMQDLLNKVDEEMIKGCDDTDN